VTPLPLLLLVLRRRTERVAFPPLSLKRGGKQRCSGWLKNPSPEIKQVRGDAFGQFPPLAMSRESGAPLRRDDLSSRAYLRWGSKRSAGSPAVDMTPLQPIAGCAGPTTEFRPAARSGPLVPCTARFAVREYPSRRESRSPSVGASRFGVGWSRSKLACRPLVTTARRISWSWTATGRRSRGDHRTDVSVLPFGSRRSDPVPAGIHDAVPGGVDSVGHLPTDLSPRTQRSLVAVTTAKVVDRQQQPSLQRRRR